MGNKVAPAPKAKPVPKKTPAAATTTKPAAKPDPVQAAPTSEPPPDTADPSKNDTTDTAGENKNANIKKFESDPAVGPAGSAPPIGRRSSLKPKVSNPDNTVEPQPKKRVSFPDENSPKPAEEPKLNDTGDPSEPKLNDTGDPSEPRSNDTGDPSEPKLNDTGDPSPTDSQPPLNPNPNNNNNNPPEGPVTKQPWKRVVAPTKPPEDSLNLLQILENVSCLFFKHCNVPVPAQAAYSSESFKYDIFDACGTRLFVAAETGKCCPICYCKTDRSFTFLVLNAEGETVFVVKRRCGCCCCCGSQLCGDMCGQSVLVELPGGTLLGEVTQLCRCRKPTYVIKNAVGTKIFRITGPCWGFSFCCRLFCEAEFNLLTFDKLETMKARALLGRVSMTWNSLTADVFEEGFMFGLNFPADLDVRLKATLLGATILISFLHFEKEPCGPSQFLCC